MTDGPTGDAARKLAAKRFDERLKLFCSFVNALGIGTIGAGVIIPASKTPFDFTPTLLVWFTLGSFLHLIAQGAYRLLRSED